MKVLIEFFRTRPGDGARAVLGRVSCDAIDSDAAVGMAKSLFRSFAMPQEPDIVRVCDDQGNELFCGAAE
jgi:hypothetical protein